jgi:hypothetical protein
MANGSASSQTLSLTRTNNNQVWTYSATIGATTYKVTIKISS